jgi:protein-L-isoaspartate O-methyltransferase
MVLARRKMAIDFPRLRREMVEEHIYARGVRSKLVLEAMGTVPREAFLPRELQEFAYEDAPLPIAEGQTISQPYIVAFMTEALILRDARLAGARALRRHHRRRRRTANP